ncbi:MAG TPA: ABC transporter substrate-binding protein, partial [Pseudonocardiaceae bacterium]|nr:ABC transporter substrate-binding protein [Pseudonocardiaceae bacterium]
MSTPRHHRLLVPVVVAVAAVLASCSSGAGAGAANSITELDYYTDTQGTAAWQRILDGCSTGTGVKISRQSVPTDQLTQKLLQGAASHSLP